MLQDGLQTLSTTSTLIGANIEHGTAFPTTDLTDGHLFYLDTSNGPILRGLYVYDLSEAAWNTATYVAKDVANGYAGLDSSSLLKASEMPAFSGDITTTAGSTVTTLANSGVTAGAYTHCTVNAKGIVTSGSNAVFDATQMPAFSGDVTSSSGSTNLTLANSGVTAGAYDTSATSITPLTISAKGLITSTGTPVTITPAFSSISGTPTTLSGYGISDAVASSAKGAANGVASLDSSGKVPVAQLPSIALVDTFTVSTQAAMLALTAQTGDVCIRTDLNETFILAVNDPTTLANWKQILTPTGAVASVAGRTGTVTLSSSDISGLAASATTDTTVASNISSGTLAAARLPAFTGDATASAGSSALTLATVNSNVGSFGSATSVPIVTVNAKGLVTGVSTATITGGSVDASTLTTGTLAAGRLPALTGDITTSAGSAATTLATSGVTAGTYTSVTVDAKGRVTAGSNPASATVTFGTSFPGSPTNGQLFYLTATSGTSTPGLYSYQTSNTTWMLATPAQSVPFDLSGYVPGLPQSSAKLMLFASARAFSIPANFTGSIAKSDIAPTGSPVYSIIKNGTQVATLTFSSGSNSGTFSTQAAISFATGDILGVVAPASVDTTHQEIMWTFLANAT